MLQSFLNFLPFVLVYCLFAYWFMFGVWIDKRHKLAAHMYTLAPLTMPYLLGQIVIARHLITFKTLEALKEIEDKKAEEKKKADAIKKAANDFAKNWAEMLAKMEAEQARARAERWPFAHPGTTSHNPFTDFFTRRRY
jgi:hypothetical protein